MGKHLTLYDRQSIERLLNQGSSIRSISKALQRPVSTISREIQSRGIHVHKCDYGVTPNRCIFRKECKRHGLCLDKPNCHRLCSTCKRCNDLCPNFQEELCSRLSLPPYVCNGCAGKKRCPLLKTLYVADAAHSHYRNLLVDSRSGFNLAEAELAAIDAACSPLIRSGHSLYHIVSSFNDSLLCSSRTLYRLVDKSMLSARNLDLPRKIRLKPRKSKGRLRKLDRYCRINRTYQDYLAFVSQHPDLPVVEMDSVIGSSGGKVLLTLHFNPFDFMLAFLRDLNTAASVYSCFDSLRSRLGDALFNRLFPILLTDNGTEFSNPSRIEQNQIHLFYCDPSSPFQKPHVELNHEFIRRILPKGTSFDSLSQDDINLMMAHINSYGRKKFGGKSPSQLFISAFGEDVLHLLWQDLIPSQNIILTPKLLSRHI